MDKIDSFQRDLIEYFFPSEHLKKYGFASPTGKRDKLEIVYEIPSIESFSMLYDELFNSTLESLRKELLSFPKM